jgi:hypothetical protein
MNTAAELSHLSNHELLVSIRVAVKIEKQALFQVLHHLNEIDLRGLHIDRGYHSLHEFLVKELGYCDGSAHRRIAAMRLLREVPEVKEQILESKITLTNLAQVQCFFQNEKKRTQADAEPAFSSKEEKLGLLNQLSGKSKEQTKAILHELSPNSQKEQKIEFIADRELLDLIQELKALEGEMPIKEIFRRGMKAHIKAIKAKRSGPTQERKPKASPGKLPTDQSKYERAHIPVAKGGSNNSENLTLLCRAHNRLQAYRQYGKAKIESHCYV